MLDSTIRVFFITYQDIKGTLLAKKEPLLIDVHFVL
jgi:hypothetical protein